jgi:hypothetical protein
MEVAGAGADRYGRSDDKQRVTESVRHGRLNHRVAHRPSRENTCENEELPRDAKHATRGAD